uniref:meiosis regulator and mRNA stability factor 1 isoform X2 n=1 Tax=Myxine glutinosa TaxID=7769 RepID=UPI00358E07D9
MEPPWPDVPVEWRVLSGQTDQSKTCCLHLSTSVIVTDSFLPVMSAKVYPEPPSSTGSKDVSTPLLSPPIQVSALGRHSTCPMLHRSPHGAETPTMIHHCSSAPLLISAHPSTNLPCGTRNFFPTNGCVGETASPARRHSACCGHCPMNSHHLTALPGTVAHPGHLPLGHSHCAHTIPPQHWQCVNCLQQSMEVLCDPSNDARRVAEPDGHANNVWPNVPLPEIPTEMPRLVEVLPGSHPSPAAPPVQTDSLAPIGVFWDIENCHVPSGRSAMAVVQRLRETLFPGHREAEFLCVCDISKEKREVIQELNNAQVTVVHINATAKNSADDKLRQSLRRFAETHAAPATAVLLSSDVNFASELSDLRHRHGFRVVLVHKAQASDALLQHAHTTLLYEDLAADLPLCPSPQPCHTLLYVHGLPGGRDPRQLGIRLRQLSENCGGKVLSVRGSRACLRFPSPVSARRAQKRLENEVVFGCRISAAFLPLDDDLGGVDNKVGKPPEETDSPEGRRLVGHGQSNAGELDEKARAAGRSVPKTRSPRQAQRKGVHAADALTPTSKGRPVGVGKEDTVGKSDLPNDGGNFPNTTSLTKRSSAVSDLQLKPSVANQEQPSSRQLGSNILTQSHEIFHTLPHAASAPTLDSDLAEQVDTRPKERAFHVGSPSAFFRPVGLLGRCQTSTPPPLTVSAPISPCRASWSPTPQMTGRHMPGSIAPSVGLMTSWSALRNLRSQIVSVLQDAPNGCMPFYRFVDVFEKRFRRQVGVTELQLLRDCVAILELGKSCHVCLLPSSSPTSPSPHPSPHRPSTPTSCDLSSTSSTPEGLEFQEPFCKDHSPNANNRDCDPEVAYLQLGNVHLSLKTFAPQVHTLLHLHTGTVPLLSFPDCYCAEFGPLLESKMEDEEGKEPQHLVPLEHLITCVPGVHVAMAMNGAKIIKWVQNRPAVLPSDSCEVRCRSPTCSPLLVRFSRELVELLGAQPHCLLPLVRFIPAYHHHFGKQCRVTELGFSRLSELLDAVPHVLQILGFGSHRVLTLTHRAQIKRFTAHLLKLLKAQASKHIRISDLPQAYHWCFSRSWDVTEYGLSEVMDLLSDVAESMVCVCSQDGETYLSLPRKEQSAEECLHTRQFAKEAVQLLRTQPHFRMLFCKFIPHYHHHFGWQCRLAHYGFLKLQELFEAVPDVVQVLECGEERILSLTETEQLKALAAHMGQLLRAAPQKGIALTHLGTAYNQTFGFPLNLSDYDASSLSELLSRIDHIVKIEEGEEVRMVVLRSRKPLRQLSRQILLLLSEEPGKPGKPVLLTRLKQLYEQTWGRTIDPKEFGFSSLAETCKTMRHEIKVLYEDKVPTAVQLTPLFQFASRVRALLQTYHGQQLFLTEFPAAFEKFTGNAPVPTKYGYTSMDKLLLAISEVVWLKDKGKKACLVLKQDLRAHFDSHGGSPTSFEGEQENENENEDDQAGELPQSSPCPKSTCSSNPDDAMATFDNHGEGLDRRETTIPNDLLSAPLPPCLPSPQLTPRSNHASESAGAATTAEQETAGGACNRASPAKRQSRSRVRLAACFSQPPEP